MGVSFGTVIPFSPEWGEIDRTSKYARQLERLGYDHLWFPDERFQRNVYAVMALASLGTKRVTLGTCVTNPYTRHLLITAAAIGTINELSRGRAILGLGAGASTLFDYHAMERPSPPTSAIREAVEVIRPMTAGRTVSYSGRTLSFRGASLDFESKPVPIYIAGRGPRLFQLAGELADGVIIGSLASKEGLDYALGNLRKGAERAGRDPRSIDVVFWAYTSMMDDEEAAKQSVKRIVVSSMWSSKSILSRLGISDSVWKPIEDVLNAGFQKGLPRDRVFSEAFEHLPDHVLDAWSVTGSPERVTRKIKSIVDSGVKHVAFTPCGGSIGDVRVMQKQLAEFVIPKFR